MASTSSAFWGSSALPKLLMLGCGALPKVSSLHMGWFFKESSTLSQTDVGKVIIASLRI